VILFRWLHSTFPWFLYYSKRLLNLYYWIKFIISSQYSFIHFNHVYLQIQSFINADKYTLWQYKLSNQLGINIYIATNTLTTSKLGTSSFCVTNMTVQRSVISLIFKWVRSYPFIYKLSKIINIIKIILKMMCQSSIVIIYIFLNFICLIYIRRKLIEYLFIDIKRWPNHQSHNSDSHVNSENDKQSDYDEMKRCKDHHRRIVKQWD